MFNLKIGAISLSLLVALTPYEAHDNNTQGDKQVVDVTGLGSQDDIEWAFVGCATYPVKTGAQSDDSIIPQLGCDFSLIKALVVSQTLIE